MISEVAGSNPGDRKLILINLLYSTNNSNDNTIYSVLMTRFKVGDTIIDITLVEDQHLELKYF